LKKQIDSKTKQPTFSLTSITLVWSSTRQYVIDSITYTKFGSKCEFYCAKMGTNLNCVA